MTTHPACNCDARPREATLADRYVHAATRGLPEDTRRNVGDELVGSIAHRLVSLREECPGISAEDAERAVLVELGDPDRLAPGRAGRLVQLIGHGSYPAYIRVLKALLVTAVPAATIVVAAIDVIDGDSIGAVIAGAAWMAFIVSTQIALWVTVTFAVVERRRGTDPARWSSAAGWTPDRLPMLPRGRRGSVSNLVRKVAWPGFLGVVIVSQHPRWPMHDVGEQLPLLDPDLWSLWLPLILVLLVVEMAFEVAKNRLSSWTPQLATINTITGAVFAAPVVYLSGTDRLFNPTAVAEIQNDWPGFDAGTASTVVLVAAVAIWAWNSADDRRRARAVQPGR